MYAAASQGPKGHAVEGQNALARAYADRNGIEIVKTYADEGGVREGRERLIEDISSGALKCDVLLMRDIARWGRFANADAIREYEAVCRRAGIGVIYIDEVSATKDGIDEAWGGTLRETGR